MNPWIAAVLRGILLEAAEQVGAEKLATLRVASPLDLPLGQRVRLAVAAPETTPWSARRGELTETP